MLHRVDGERLTEKRRLSGVGLAAALVALALAIGACGATSSAGQGGGSGGNGGTPSPTPTATTDSGSGGGGGGGSGTSTPTPGGSPTFHVTGITISVSPNTFTGACSSTMVFTFTANILVPAGTPGGTVKYRWYRSDGASSSSDQTVAFAAGETSKAVTTTWSLGAMWGNGSTFWEQVKASDPNVWYSPHGNFSFNCQVKVNSASLSVSPTCWSNSGTQVFTFSGTFNVSPGPASTITYTWLRSDGGHSGTPLTLSVPAGATSVAITSQTWQLWAPQSAGTYWEEVIVSAPNAYTSGHANFTIKNSAC